MIKVCHITSVHHSTDTRILYKECVSLAENGYDVHLVAPNSIEREEFGVKVHSVKNSSKSRFFRATIVSCRVLRKALKIRAKIYHFHDPELIWVGTILRLFGKKVVFDIHENIRAQIADKDWLPLNKLISKIYFLFDWWASKLFHIVLADVSYEEMYKNISNHYVVLENLPKNQKLKKFAVVDRAALENGILYIGVVSQQRGILEIMEALAKLHEQGIDFFFHCVGPIGDGFREEIESYEHYVKIKKKVKFYGSLPLYDAYSLSVNCKVGLSILHPIGNYIESLSTKIFEYMSVGLPFIVSNFELYKFVKSEELGLLVDPMSSEAISKQIKLLLNDSELSNAFGERGIIAADQKYTWNSQELKMLSFYTEILK